MDIQVNITAEQINEAVAQKIVNSCLGEQLQIVIKKTLETMSRSWDNPYEKVIQHFVNDEIKKVLHDTYSETLKEKIKEKLTDEFVQKYIDNAYNRLVGY